MVRAELQWAVPMCVPLPVDMPSPEHFFPFLDGTLDDLGILPSEVREKVVWVDTTRTRVRSNSGELKEKEIVVLELRVKAQQPGQRQSQEIVYSTESQTQRSYCRKGPMTMPWEDASAESRLKPAEMLLALDTELKPKWQKTEKKQNM
uniref:Si:ch211-196f5.2 n=1 Tax=Paramormyrops kingsleyae TaxID=1676925 RepID=A0A3B3S3D7_9TELE